MVKEKGSSKWPKDPFLSQKEHSKEGRRVLVGETRGTSTSPGAQSSPCLPCSLQEEREKAREQIMLKVTEITVRMAFQNLGQPSNLVNPHIITKQFVFQNTQALLLGLTLNKRWQQA